MQTNGANIMEPKDLEAEMRRSEYFHALRVPDGMWTVIRLDGRNFSKETKYFEKPFDNDFHHLMEEVARYLFVELNALFATTHSDEISLLFPPVFNMFDREVEKIVSTSAGMASAAYSLQSNSIATFDSRIWIGAAKETVAEYFLWRANDAFRGCINSWAYWTLRLKAKMSKHEATSTLNGIKTSEKHDLLHGYGININDVPTWQRRGVGFVWEKFKKTGYNPLTNEEVITDRRRVKLHEELPQNSDDFYDFVRFITHFETLDEGVR
jgi:tRNA(His) guanylyltransferase